MKKDIFETVLLVVMFAFVGFRLYQKYIKKDNNSEGGGSKESSKLSHTGRNDDYDPYIKK
jgi:hypothetical protein